MSDTNKQADLDSSRKYDGIGDHEAWTRTVALCPPVNDGGCDSGAPPDAWKKILSLCEPKREGWRDGCRFNSRPCYIPGGRQDLWSCAELVGAIATRPPRLRNEAEIQKARDWLDAAVRAMSGCAGLYLFLEPDFEHYARWLSVVAEHSGLRIISIGSAREAVWFWPRAALVVIQAEVVDSGRGLRTRMPLTLPEGPSSRDDAEWRGWFHDTAVQILGLEKSWKWFADPIAGDGELVRAASRIFEDTFCAEQRPWAVARAITLGNYLPEDDDGGGEDQDDGEEVLS